MTGRNLWNTAVAVMVVMLLTGGVLAGEVEMRGTAAQDPDDKKKERAEMATNPKKECPFLTPSAFVDCFAEGFAEAGFSVEDQLGGQAVPDGSGYLILDAEVMRTDPGGGGEIDIEDLCVQEDDLLINGIRIHLAKNGLLAKIDLFGQSPAGGTLEITIEDVVVTIPDTTDTGGQSLTEHMVDQLALHGFTAAAKFGEITVFKYNAQPIHFHTVGLWTDDPGLMELRVALVQQVMGVPQAVECSPKSLKDL